jgi:tRNA A-37 threonylcarbamoyl transferase component Bud32
MTTRHQTRQRSRTAIEQPSEDDSAAVPAPDPAHAEVDGREDLFLDLISEVFASEPALAEGWRIVPRSKGSELWVSAHKDGNAMPSQGWKLHVSAAPLSSQEVLRRALPVLLNEAASFKVVSSIPKLSELNSGIYGLSQIGKFLTIFPFSDEQAVRLAVALDEATHGLPGPTIPSDHPLKPGSLVHYRYGGFVRDFVEPRPGDLQLAIHAPDGEAVPDQRLTTFSPPGWVVDPFVAAGVSSPLPASSPLVNGRYLITSTLYAAARGEVYLAVDLHLTRSCVLKHALRNGALGIDGTDACDRLRNEEAVLARLAPDPRFPTLYELFEQGGDLWLAMELVEGETLFQYVRRLAMEGRHLPSAQIMAWGKEAADLLSTIHGAGLVYRDLKAANVFVTPEGTLRLLDFDVSQEIGSPIALYSPGTVGYISREQKANEPPQIWHDVYSLGALLYFMATGAEPSLYPRPYSLLDRPLELMNPEVDPVVADVIRRCLHPDSGSRYPSAEAVGAALAPGGGVTPQVRGVEQAARAMPSPDHYRALAAQLGEALCAAAPWRDGHEVTWVNHHNPEWHINSRNISMGAAGTLLALAQMAVETEDARYFEAVEAGARWLLSAPRTEGVPLPGLYTGEAGVAVALLRAGQVLRDAKLLGAAAERGRWVASLPHDKTALFSGSAGRLRAHLLIWDETREETQLEAAIEVGEHILRSADSAGAGMLHWTVPPGNEPHSGRAYTGYATGAAGSADALLDLVEATGDERYLGAAQNTARWLKSLALPALDDDSGLDWPQFAGEPLGGAHWGHGAAGIGTFFLHAHRLGVVPGASRIASKAARSAAYGARWSGPTFGYGLCGNIEFLLDMYQEEGDDSYLDGALAIGRLLEAFSVEREGFRVWPAEIPSVFATSYAVGNAGVAACLLRLSDPARLPALLSRRAFLRTRK